MRNIALFPLYRINDLMRSIATDSPLLRHARPQSEAERLPLRLQRVVDSVGLLQGIPQRTAASLPFLSARSAGLFLQGLQISRLTGKGVYRSVISGAGRDESAISGSGRDESVICGDERDESDTSGAGKYELITSGAGRDESVTSAAERQVSYIRGWKR